MPAASACVPHSLPTELMCVPAAAVVRPARRVSPRGDRAPAWRAALCAVQQDLWLRALGVRSVRRRELRGRLLLHRRLRTSLPAALSHSRLWWQIHQHRFSSHRPLDRSASSSGSAGGIAGCTPRGCASQTIRAGRYVAQRLVLRRNAVSLYNSKGRACSSRVRATLSHPGFAPDF